MENLMDVTRVVEHPYLVYNSNQDMIDKINSNLMRGTQLDALRTREGETLSILEAQIKTEREKEIKFVEAIELFFRENGLFEQNRLSTAYYTGEYSQMITLFDAYSQGVLTGKEDLNTALKAIEAFYKQFNYNSMDALVTKFFNDKADTILNQNVDTAFEKLKEYLENQFMDNKVQRLMKQTIEELKSQFFQKKQTLNPDDLITIEINKKYTSKDKTKTIFEQFRSDIVGMIRGLPSEVFVGRGKTTGTLLKGNLNPDTDAVVIFDADLQVKSDEIMQLALQDSYEKLREAEKLLKNRYILHSSVKAGSGATIKIKGEANYLARFNEIKDMLRELNISNAQDFLLLFANTIPGMAAEDRWDDVKTVLLQLSTIYMFDDILPPLVENIKQETYNTDKINFYNIQGRIFVASEIFQTMYNSIEGKKAKTIVTIGGPTGKEIDYPKEIARIKDTTERWEKVYKLGMSKTGLNKFTLNVDNLVNLLLIP